MPREVGVQNHLWSLSKHHKERGIIESGFFSSVDARAAEILKKLEQRRRLEDVERGDWALFVSSLLIRSPATVEHIKSKMPSELMKYAKQHAPYTTLQNLEILPGYLQDVVLSTLMLCTEDQRFLETLLNMDWAIRYFSEFKNQLLISDQVVARTFSVSDPRCILSFPVSPVSCFIATSNKTYLAKLMNISDREFIATLNKGAASLAHSFIVGDCQKTFLERYFLVPLKAEQ